MGSSSTSSSLSISLNRIKLVLERLKCEKNRSSTKKNYLNIWHNFSNFVMKLDIKPKSWEEHTSMYCAYLVDCGAQSSTIKSYTSAIKCILTLDGYHWDDNKVLLPVITGACKVVNDVVKTRLPIHINLLEVLLFEVGQMFRNQYYLEIMYKTMLLIGYYGLLRIEELTKSPHTIRARNVHVGTNKDKILIVLYSSKTHGKESQPQQIKIQMDQTSSLMRANRHFSPSKLTRLYLKLRGGYKTDEEQFFVFSDLSPVASHHFRTVLNKLLMSINLNPKLYSSHSLRSGRSTDLIKAGFTVEQVKRLGRWRLNAIYKYLK